jgi:hypothetical protein
LLNVSYVSFEPFLLSGEVGTLHDLEIVLTEDVNSLETVVISAGSFSAGDNSKISVLKPLDVVTTASALGDFVGALQTLPGTTTVAEDGRLFVRGGEAGETQIFIDGIRVFTPYTPTTNNAPTRGRYSPFLFDGITFSTGGYSAEYGQALSSVLLLNTIDEPEQDKTDIAIMTVGGGVGNTQKWERGSVSFNANYINLAPYLAIYPDRNDWDKPFETVAGEAVFRQQVGGGLLKVYTAMDHSNFSLTQEDINFPQGIDYALNNINWYTNASYRTELGNNWWIRTGGSYTYARTMVNFDSTSVSNTEHSAHLKLSVKKHFSNRVKLSVGAEQFLTDFDEEFDRKEVAAEFGYQYPITAGFAETDLIFSRSVALKLGMRGEYSALPDSFTLSPRLSLAVKTDTNGQLSLAWGKFFQQADQALLKFDNGLDEPMTQHFILNYQWRANNRIFRAEVYYKDYDDLVTHTGLMPSPQSSFGNGGSGYAGGIDLFWRDNESIEDLDYWVSYSYLDSERQYLNYPEQARPPFANAHNLSVVAKWWIPDWKSQIGGAYQFGSGRTYTDRNQPGFLQATTRSYNSISLNWAYLISPQKILYASVNNVFGFNNVNGYQYAAIPDANGNFARRPLLPAADQFFFVGFFWTISEDGTDNQLDNL